MAEIDQPRPASAWTSTSSPCVSIGRGLSAAAGLEHRQQRVGPRPIRWTRPSGWPDPGAQTWGDSVISSGEIPLIRDNDAIGEDDVRYQVKARRLTARNTSRQLGV